MACTLPMKFPIRFEAWYRVLSSMVLLPPKDAYVRVLADRVEVKMGWAFSAAFPVSAVTKTSPLREHPLSRGVHGFAGRWLVNGSGDRILVIDLAPGQRARVLGVGVKLRQLMVSIDDPVGLAARLSPAAPG